MELEHWQRVQNRIPRSDILRIVLIGETGAGKSSSGNTIFGRRVFTTKSSDRDISVGCVQGITRYDGQWLSIVDTPGFFDPNKSNVEVEREIANGLALAAPGPHVFLLVLRPDGIKYKEQTGFRIIQTLFRKLAAHFTTNKERETVKIIEKMFGNLASCYTMILFTHGDDLENGRAIEEFVDLEHGKTIEDFIDRSPDLRALIRQCGGGYHVFNNRDEDPSQVRELLEKINTMVQRNGGSFYTKDLAQRVNVEYRYLHGFAIAFMGSFINAIGILPLVEFAGAFAVVGAAVSIVTANFPGSVEASLGAGFAGTAAIAAFGTTEGVAVTVTAGVASVAGAAVGAALAGADSGVAAAFGAVAGGLAAGVAAVQASSALGVSLFTLLGNTATTMFGQPVTSALTFIVWVAYRAWLQGRAEV